jgi:AraC-like DNA-binding protein
MNSRVARATDPSLLIDSSDPAEVDHFLTAHFVDKHDLLGDRTGFRFELRLQQVGSVSIIPCRTNVSSLGAFRGSDFVCIQFHFDGNSEVRSGRKRLPLTASSAGIIPPGSAYQMWFDDSYDGVLMGIDQADLRRKLAALIGEDVGDHAGAPLRFELADSGGHPDMMTLRAFAANIRSAGFPYFGDVSPIVQAELSQAWLLAVLSGTLHNYSDKLSDAAAVEVASRQVRRAVDYIEFNWNKPLLVEDIAAAVDVSARSLFRTFRKFTGLSPTQYIRSVRLKKAQALLLDGEQTTNVGDVTAACGFHNSGQFARDYRQTFGELPSETLARASRLKLSAKRFVI